MKKKVTVIGLGYIGLPTSLFFAKHGFDVYGVDTNQAIVDTLNNGKLTFNEPGMTDLFEAAKKNIYFTTIPEEADLFIITVPTPFLENKTIDEKYIDQAFEDISLYLKVGDSIVLESTVPPLITEKLVSKIEKLGFVVGETIFLAHVPETIIPGNMLVEFTQNKRLIGGYSQECSEKIASFYEKVVDGEIIYTDMRTAEIVKVMENTYRDVNIALANELMRLCDELEIDVQEAIQIANKHPRVNIHTPGGGVGGHCISVDPWFLVGIFGEEKANIISTARKINDEQPQYIYKKLSKIYNLQSLKVGVYGLAYKPDIDDFRESPSFEFIKILQTNKIDYISFDPHATQKIESNQTMDKLNFLEEADIIIVYVKHSDLTSIQSSKLVYIN
ncbi:MAG: nucleotide sugar dehydrogenase [Mycoplasmatales bacterium]